MPVDFSAYHAVLLDLDGTLCHEDRALPGAVELVARLQREQKNIAILTNSCDGPEQVMRRLADMGMAVRPEVIYTAARAACDYVLQRWADAFGGERARVFNLSTESVYEMLGNEVDWVTDAGETCDAIICGAPANLHATEDRRRTALRLARGGATVVGCCADRIYPSPRGIEFGSGALTGMLSYAANVTPVFCGKPEKTFFLELCRRLAVDSSKCLLIGDNLESDIAGAKRVGMQAILSLGGVSRLEDVSLLETAMRPDQIVESLRELA